MPRRQCCPAPGGWCRTCHLFPRQAPSHQPPARPERPQQRAGGLPVSSGRGWTAQEKDFSFSSSSSFLLLPRAAHPLPSQPHRETAQHPPGPPPQGRCSRRDPWRRAGRGRGFERPPPPHPIGTGFLPRRPGAPLRPAPHRGRTGTRWPPGHHPACLGSPHWTAH